MKLRKVIAIILCVLLLCGCAQDETQPQDPDGEQPKETVVSTVIDTDDAFSKRDLNDEVDERSCVTISLNGTDAVFDGEGVSVSDSTVTISKEGIYLLTGSFEGMIVVDASKSDKIQLVLKNVNITSETSAAIYVKKADKVFITTSPGTENTLKNGGEFVAIDDNNIDATVFSKDDLTLNGQGKLIVQSPAGHGIVCKDDLVIGSGSYEVSSAGHGIAGKDSLCIAKGNLTVSAGKDAIHAENSDDTALGYVYLADGTYDLTAEGDGVSASNSLQIDGGSFTITAGGGAANGGKDHSDGYGQFGGGRPGGFGGWFGGGNGADSDSSDSTSMKGIKSAGDLSINDGTFRINAADDALHTNSNMTVVGGTFNIATGDDGLHADDTLTVSGGNITITESYEGLEALHLVITGGNIDLVATDDGLNAAGGTDNSGFGGRDNMGEMPNGMGDAPGGMGDAPDGMGKDPGDSEPGISRMGGGRPGGNQGGMGGFGGMGGMGGMSSSNGTIKISGGTIYIQASGDGIDANGTLEITGGDITICGPNSGDTASLDFDLTGTISGGTVIATGASGMAQTFSSADQGVINYKASAQKAGTQVTLKDENGNIILSVTPVLDYSMIILTCPTLKSGETYTLIIGATTKQVTAT